MGLTWIIPSCNELRSSLLVFVFASVRLTKLKVCLIWLLKISWFPFKISMLFLIAFISSVLLLIPNKKLNREWIIPHLV